MYTGSKHVLSKYLDKRLPVWFGQVNGFKTFGDNPLLAAPSKHCISIYLFVITVDSLSFGSASGWLGHLRLKDDLYSAFKCWDKSSRAFLCFL